MKCKKLIRKITQPAACCRSRPVGETRFPVARKFANRAPISKFTRAKTLWRCRSSNERQFYCLGGTIARPFLYRLKSQLISLAFGHLGLFDCGPDSALPQV